MLRPKVNFHPAGSPLPRFTSSHGQNIVNSRGTSPSQATGFTGDAYSSPTGSCEVRSYGGNGGGACCVFPFTYKGNTYHSCTNQSATEFAFFGEPWCSVTDNYDRDRKRGLCVNEQGKGPFAHTHTPWA